MAQATTQLYWSGERVSEQTRKLAASLNIAECGSCNFGNVPDNPSDAWVDARLTEYWVPKTWSGPISIDRENHVDATIRGPFDLTQEPEIDPLARVTALNRTAKLIQQVKRLRPRATNIGCYGHPPFWQIAGQANYVLRVNQIAMLCANQCTVGDGLFATCYFRGQDYLNWPDSIRAAIDCAAHRPGCKLFLFIMGRQEFGTVLGPVLEKSTLSEALNLYLSLCGVLAPLKRIDGIVYWQAQRSWGLTDAQADVEHDMVLRTMREVVA